MGYEPFPPPPAVPDPRADTTGVRLAAGAPISSRPEQA